MSDTSSPSNETPNDFVPGDIGAAFGLLTRLPVPRTVAPSGEVIRNGIWAYPLVGLILGLCGGVLLWLLLAIGITAPVSTALALGFQMLLTGALHEDGLADTADGLGGGKSREHTLEIMRDSRIGTFGIATLTIVLIAKWAALSALAHAHPIAAMALVGTLSRWPMVLMMFGMQNARKDGLSQMVGRPGLNYVLAASGIAVLVALVTSGFWFPVILLVAALASVPVIFWASRCIDGQTGDILGAAQQCSELALLAVLTAIWI